MEEIISNNYQNKSLVCDKGNILLESYFRDNKKAYYLKYDFKNLDSNKVNIQSLFGFEIYELLEKVNSDLIEKIIILNKLNEDEIDICILLKHIAKEIGIKQKYLLFRSKKEIDSDTKNIIYNNKDLSLIDNELKKKYLNIMQIDSNKIESLIFNYGKTIISLNNLDSSELNNNKNLNKLIDIDFKFDFQILIGDDLPIYMENFVGLMFKKIFYNLKQFIDNLNNIVI
tara:strand:- start:534 stop:1217 length:684 start_codon:yes stop_codon:yes gene_type:complete